MLPGIESQPDRPGLLVPLVIGVVFLGTAVVMWWDPWGQPVVLRPHRGLDPDVVLPVPVRDTPQPLLYRGSEKCKECHSKRKYRKLWNDWRRGGHKEVACESCHGPADDHVLADIDPRPALPVGLEKLAKPHVLCLGCHGKIDGRQASLPQIDYEKHLAGFQVKKDDPEYQEARQCLSCHDPHRPVKK